MSRCLTFDEGATVVALGAMSTWQRTLFAAACAERLVPAYQRYSNIEGCGDLEAIKGSLSLLWEALCSVGDSSGWDEIVRSVEGAIPEEGDWNEWAPCAENAAAAIVYAWRTWLEGDAQLAAWAARQAYEAADYLAGQNVEGTAFDERVENALLASDVVQKELQCETEDLWRIANCLDGDLEFPVILRRLARSNAIVLSCENG